MFSKNKKVIHNGCTLGCEYIIILKADTHVVDLKKKRYLKIQETAQNRHLNGTNPPKEA